MASPCRDLRLIPEPCGVAQSPDCSLALRHSVYPVAADGEAVYLQQVFLRPPVLRSVAVQPRVGVDHFVVVLVRRGQEGVRLALGDGGGGGLCQVGGLRLLGRRAGRSWFGGCVWVEDDRR